MLWYVQKKCCHIFFTCVVLRCNDKFMAIEYVNRVHTEQVSLVVTLVFKDCSVHILARTSGLTEVSHRFPQSLHTNARIVL
jgi:hypothetical protein